MPCDSSMGKTHHGFVSTEYNVNRMPKTNSTNDIAFTWPILLMNHPDMKKNGNSPPNVCVLCTKPCKVFMRSWLLQLIIYSNKKEKKKQNEMHVELFHIVRMIAWLTRHVGQPNLRDAKRGNSIPVPCKDQPICTTRRTQRFEPIWIVCQCLWLCSMKICSAWTAVHENQMVWIRNLSYARAKVSGALTSRQLETKTLGSNAATIK